MNKISALLILILVFASLTLCDFYCHTPVDVSTESRDKLKSIDANYRSEVKAFQMVTGKLEKQIQEADSLLQSEKNKVAVSNTKIQKMLQSNWEVPLEEKSAKCDSLREQVNEYQIAQTTKDSIAESKIELLTELVKEQETRITDCDQSYQEIKNALENSIKENTALSENFTKQLKKERRKNIKNKLLAIGTIIASVATVSFIISK